MKFIRMRETAAIEERLVFDIRRIDDKRVPFPSANRIAHKRGKVILAVLTLKIDLPSRSQPFPKDRDMVVLLQNIESPEHRQSRHSDRVAFEHRIDVGIAAIDARLLLGVELLPLWRDTELVVRKQGAVTTIGPALPETTEVRVSIQHRLRTGVSRQKNQNQRSATAKHHFPRAHIK